MSEPETQAGQVAVADSGANKETPKSTPKPTPKEVIKVRRRLVTASLLTFFTVDLLMFLRFFFPRALFEPKTSFILGYPSDFSYGVDTRFQQNARIWVVRNSEGLFVIYARCTHLGCTPDWKDGENKFKCPCHGSGYDNEGVNFEGPAPRPMDRAHVVLNPGGQIVVDTARLYVRDPFRGVDQFGDDGAILRGV
ncbi:MAG: Rieske (2Fe-2S) protein [Acidobacteria bacterium]|nr:Rieske (2Fe-2S) protein [Acidobacteriota bacterium]